MNHGLPEATVVKIHAVFARHPQLAKAVLYGSRAKGTYKPGSDIDLALYGEGLGPREVRALEDELDELLLPYGIDLVVFATLDHPQLREHIERVGQEFYSRHD